MGGGIMQIIIRGHHLSITPAIEQQIHQHLEKTTKHLHEICSIQVSLQKNHRLTSRSHKGQDNHNAEMIIRLPGRELFAQAASDNMYQAIAALMEKMSRQLNKYKELKAA